MICLGFTGTRAGMTDAQEGSVSKLLIDLHRLIGIGEADHGDCQGADAMFHHMLLTYTPEAWINVYPGMDQYGKSPSRAYCQPFKGYGRIHKPQPYHGRNVTIVQNKDIVIATPKEPSEVRAGGTWHAVRAARRSAAKQVVIVWPDGTKQLERP